MSKRTYSNRNTARGSVSTYSRFSLAGFGDENNGNGYSKRPRMEELEADLTKTLPSVQKKGEKKTLSMEKSGLERSNTSGFRTGDEEGAVDGEKMLSTMKCESKRSAGHVSRSGSDDEAADNEQTTAIPKSDSKKSFSRPVSAPTHDSETEDTTTSPQNKATPPLLEQATDEPSTKIPCKRCDALHGSRETTPSNMPIPKKKTAPSRPVTPQLQYAGISKLRPRRLSCTSTPKRRQTVTAPSAVTQPIATAIHEEVRRGSMMSATSRLVDSVVANDEQAPLQEPTKTASQFGACMTLPPHKTLFGGPSLSYRPKEVSLWTINQTESPLLRLPGEVRNAIYQYALGGNCIKIGFETFRSAYKGNIATISWPVFKYDCVVYQDNIDAYRSSEYAGIPVSHGFTLLSGVCRQLYLETAVLPYELNLFSFASYNVMFNMLFMERRLSSRQLDVIKRVVVVDQLPAANLLRLLPNLKQVFLVSYAAQNICPGWYVVHRGNGKEEPGLFRYTGRRCGNGERERIWVTDLHRDYNPLSLEEFN